MLKLSRLVFRRSSIFVLLVISACTSAFLVSANSTSAGAPAASSAASAVGTYKGKHSDWVTRLLDRTGEYSCPNAAGEGGKPPKVLAEECIRDKYVAAAVVYAWAAECYARNEEENKAQEAAVQMYDNLKSAQGLCSNAPSFNFGGPRKECDTMKIYQCGEISE